MDKDHPSIPQEMPPTKQEPEIKENDVPETIEPPDEPPVTIPSEEPSPAIPDEMPPLPNTGTITGL